jgi:hypothetical protein
LFSVSGSAQNNHGNIRLKIYGLLLKHAERMERALKREGN